MAWKLGKSGGSGGRDVRIRGATLLKETAKFFRLWNSNNNNKNNNKQTKPTAEYGMQNNKSSLDPFTVKSSNIK